MRASCDRDVPPGKPARVSSRDDEYTEYISARLTSLRRTAYLLCQDWHRADDLVQSTITQLYVHWGRARAAGRSTPTPGPCLSVSSSRAPLSLGPPGQPGRQGPGVQGRHHRLRRTARPARRARGGAAAPAGHAGPAVLLRPERRADRARVLGCSAGTVKSQTAKGLAALRRALDPEPAGDASMGPVSKPAGSPPWMRSRRAPFSRACPAPRSRPRGSASNWPGSAGAGGYRAGGRCLSGTPAVAVAVVALLASGILPGSAHSPHRSGHPAAGPPPVPSRTFNPLVPYAAFGWLPAGNRLIAGTTGRVSQFLAAGPKGSAHWTLTAISQGRCNLTAGQVLAAAPAGRPAGAPLRHRPGRTGSADRQGPGPVGQRAAGLQDRLRPGVGVRAGQLG